MPALNDDMANVLKQNILAEKANLSSGTSIKSEQTKPPSHNMLNQSTEQEAIPLPINSESPRVVRRRTVLESGESQLNSSILDNSLFVELKPCFENEEKP